MPLTYAMFHIPVDPRFGVVKNLDDRLEDSWRLREGTSMASDFPASVEMDLHPSGGDLITDFVNNIDGAVMVSDKARKVLEAEGVVPPHLEYLPFTLKDKNGRRVKDRFWIVNVLRVIPCFDLGRSVYKRYKHNNKIQNTSLRRLFIHEDRLPADAKLFRTAELTDPIIIRSDLLDRLEAEGCTGMSVVPLGEEII